MNNKVSIILDEQNTNSIILESPKELSLTILNELVSYKVEATENNNLIYKIPIMPYNCFVVACLYIKSSSMFLLDENSFNRIKLYASSVCKPQAFIHNDGYIGIHVPSIPAYERLMSVLGAKHARLTLWTIPFSRLYEAYRMISIYKHPFLPSLEIKEDLSEYVREEISENNSMEDLFKVELKDLISVKKGWQIKPEGFSKLKYTTAADLLLRRPKSYIDRRNIASFKRAPYGKPLYFYGQVVSFSSSFGQNSFMELNDGSTTFEITFWGNGYLTKVYRPGTFVYVEAIKIGHNKANGSKIVSPEEVSALPVTPVYRQAPSSKITTKVLTNCVEELLMRFKGDNLASYIHTDGRSLWKLLNDLHFPKDLETYYETLDRLAFIELFYMQLLFLDKKKNEVKRKGIVREKRKTSLTEEAINSLPYKLTSEGKGQAQAIKTIFSRMRASDPADMLLSADVGAGKTTCAVAACLYNVETGFQSVLAGPTEILARQLYDNLERFIAPLSNKPTIAYLSGNTKAKEKRDIEKGVREGHIDILVGTHGVFNLEYKNLGLIVIDEEQKFGRAQREQLLFSRKDGRIPDILKQTATPIPQTTALAFYGDIDLINITSKPGARKENITEWVRMSSDDFVNNTNTDYWNHIKSEINNGRQIFIVTPAVNEEAKSASVKAVQKILEKTFKDKISIDIVHGQMKREQQNKKLLEFRENKFNILIASSVIEVGIDIPNATVMLVLDADRFGASSLHQIRGRVGRSDHQGYCFLVSGNQSKNTEKRLSSLVNSNDGFEIALVDLETRKEGDLFGEKQSGESKLMFCDFTDHTSLVEVAKTEAEKIYNSNIKELALRDAKAFLKFTEKEEE